jgi:hypothetical protein
MRPISVDFAADGTYRIDHTLIGLCLRLPCQLSPQTLPQTGGFVLIEKRRLHVQFHSEPMGLRGAVHWGRAGGQHLPSSTALSLKMFRPVHVGRS